MTSRTLVSGTLAVPAKRRIRNSDGGMFAVAIVHDRDRDEVRKWKVFINDLELIERFEALKIGEPIAISGPFYVTLTEDGSEFEYRVSAQQLADLKRPKKSRSIKAKEARVKSDEWNEAPSDPNDEMPDFGAPQ